MAERDKAQARDITILITTVKSFIVQSLRMIFTNGLTNLLQSFFWGRGGVPPHECVHLN